MSVEELPEVKLCVRCGLVKPLENNYYRAGKGYQKLCIPCHNLRRYEYAFNRHYNKRPKGYIKLPAEVRANIERDIYIKVNLKTVAAKYEDINYHTLLRWRREGQIPKYSGPPIAN